MTVSIVDARVKLAAVLAPQTDGDPAVHDNIVDALVPPCMVLQWQIPMIDGWGVCNAYANLNVTLIAGRVDAAPGIEVIESMYDLLQRRLSEHSADSWIVRSDGGIVVTSIGAVQYLACRVEVRVPLAL